MGTKNRAQRRIKQKMRLTKKVRVVRGKTLYGGLDCTQALKLGISPTVFAGLTYRNISLADVIKGFDEKILGQNK